MRVLRGRVDRERDLAIRALQDDLRVLTTNFVPPSDAAHDFGSEGLREASGRQSAFCAHRSELFCQKRYQLVSEHSPGGSELLLRPRVRVRLHAHLGAELVHALSAELPDHADDLVEQLVRLSEPGCSDLALEVLDSDPGVAFWLSFGLIFVLVL